MNEIFRAVYQTAIGLVTLEGTEAALTALRFGGKAEATDRKTTLFEQTAQELHEYLAGQRRDFSVPLMPQGTDFQRLVWETLRTIPYGETRAYAQIAEAIGNRKACRAVGMANNKNPIAILIPCHRVLGADGTLTGYAGGLDLKNRLLTLESIE